MDKQTQNFNKKSIYSSTSIADIFSLLYATANSNAPFTAHTLHKHSREGIRTNIELSNRFDIEGFGKIIPVWQSARGELMEK